ncbi:MAG: UDP-N-acetylmuramate dehydrogenase [Phycisphaerales bacterium]|nr:MAG: UDP-N-acetylmuramate dehydrogenase [Phycisphaerales bacterium]
MCRTHGLIPLVDEPLRRHSTWRIGGPADSLLEPASWAQVGALLRCADEHGIPVLIIGKGSNLLFADAGVRGVVIKIGRSLAGLSISGTTVRAEVGISASRLARTAGLAGLTGLEHIVGIPGTLGGLVVMNGGSLRRAIGEVIVEVKTMDRRGTPAVWRREDCEFAYRQSRFQRDDCVITEVILELAPGPCTEIMSEMRAVLRERRRRFPLTLPSCGSVFKRNAELTQSVGPPGAVIEGLGFKGRRVGDAVVNSRHANFIVNVGAARARDVLELVGIIRQAVQDRFGHTLACEAKYVDEHARVCPLEQALDR